MPCQLEAHFNKKLFLSRDYWLTVALCKTNNFYLND